MFPASDDYPHGQRKQVYAELRKLIPESRLLAPNLPLMFAICAPCQSFTKFVQRKMTPYRSETRKRDQSLLAQTIGFIEEFRPNLIISENVSNIERGEYLDIWQEFQEQLRQMGYNIGVGRVCASKFGVPQFRKRSIVMAMNKGASDRLDFDIPIPNHDPDVPPWPSSGGAIGHLPRLKAGESSSEVPNHICRNLTEKNRLRLMSVKPGEPNFAFAESKFGDLSLPCHDRLNRRGKRGFGDVYTRMSPDRPAPTITTRFHSISNGRFGHFDESQVRGLSLREGASLQSFREDYEFFGAGMDSIARMIGNAVPPKLSAYMAQWLLGLWVDYEECGFQAS
jgi:DNA (cytosine-5)-methyltransferase 1